MLALANMLLEKKNSIVLYKEAKSLLNKTILLDPTNFLAWHLKGIAHIKLNEVILANLSAAEEFLIRRDYDRTKYFAKKVLDASEKNSSENIRARDILNIVN